MLDEFKASHAAANDPRAVAENEVRSYINHLPTDEEEQNALLFWKTHCDQYPSLAALAREHLSVPATSVPVEAMFSTTGLILNSKRSSLSPANMNMILFIHDNIDAINSEH